MRPSPVFLRQFLAGSALVIFSFSQTSCGMIAHNVRRLISIPASILGEEGGSPTQPAPGIGEAPASSLLDVAPSPDLGPPAPVPTA